MKKSKVLIPAMALLLFSTAASVTSTVAWFTSTRVYNTSVSQFKVAKIDGNLECTMTGVVGTTAGLSDGKPVMYLKTTENNVEYTTLLGDASLDCVSTHPALWTDNPNGAGYVKIDDLASSNNAFAPTDAAKWHAYTDTAANPKLKYYYAAMWTMEFKYTFASIGGTANIFFDYKNSELKYGEGTFNPSADAQDSIRGFRLAFLAPNTTGESETANKRLIWSPHDDGIKREFSGMSSSEPSAVEVWSVGDTEDENAYQYVKSETGENALGQYTTNFVNSKQVSTSYSRADDTTDSQSTRLDYLAGITKPNNADSATVKITCVAWFEGTNSNIQDRTAMKALVANLQFYAAMNKPAAPNAGD